MLWHVVLWNKSNQIIPPAYNWPESLQIFMEQHLNHNIMSLYTQFALQQICTPPLYHRGVKHQYWCTLRPHLKTNCEKITPDTKPLNESPNNKLESSGRSYYWWKINNIRMYVSFAHCVTWSLTRGQHHIVVNANSDEQWTTKQM